MIHTTKMSPFFVSDMKSKVKESGVLFTFMFPVVLLWDPDAGIVPSLTKLPGVTVAATSNQGLAHNVLDNNDSTHWTSSHCLPSGYFSRADVNILHGACADGRCSASGVPRNDLAGATDGTPYTTGHFATVTGTDGRKSAFFSVNICSPTELKVLTIDGIFKNTTEVHVFKVDGSNNLIATLNQSDSYHSKQVLDIDYPVNRIELRSDNDIGIRDIAAIGPNGCREILKVDLGVLRNVGTIRTRHWAGVNTAMSLGLKTSVDGVHWKLVKTLDPNALYAVTTKLVSASIRYIQLEYQVALRNWNKVYCWEIDAWDENGRWGPKVTPKPQTNTLRSILGVNGIWGWGHKTYSSSLKQGEGPWLYNAVASHARNYHNLNWDVTDPDNDPQFQTMGQGHGTQAKKWLNWDTEYGAWNNASLMVDASIQFTNKSFSQSVWDHPEQAASNYGNAFAKHFGPGGKGLVAAMEVGNEPWDYDAGFYATVLKGMSSGARKGDPHIKVLPGAFQADDKHATGNYIGTRVLQEVATIIDVINFHTYSYYHTDQGTRTGIFPEHNESSFNSLRNIIRWRDANMPGTPIWVTEWGWDAPGEGENCVVPECVSETEQSLYGIRGLLILARHNIEKATWFFYANSDTCNTLYCRSGLTASTNHNFAKKKVFLEFQSLFNLIGDKYFLGIVREDSEAYIYMFSDSPNTGNPNETLTSLLFKTSYLVAWRPVAETDKNVTKAQIHLPQDITIHTSKLFDGLGARPVVLSGLKNGILTLHLTSRPLLIGLGRVDTGTIVG